jgi:hypothetical protein
VFHNSSASPENVNSLFNNYRPLCVCHFRSHFFIALMALQFKGLDVFLLLQIFCTRLT